MNPFHLNSVQICPFEAVSMYIHRRYAIWTKFIHFKIIRLLNIYNQIIRKSDSIFKYLNFCPNSVSSMYIHRHRSNGQIWTEMMYNYL